MTEIEMHQHQSLRAGVFKTLIGVGIAGVVPLVAASVATATTLGLGVSATQAQRKVALEDGHINWQSGKIGSLPALEGVGDAGYSTYVLRGPLTDLSGFSVTVQFSAKKANALATQAGRILGADVASFAGASAVPWLYDHITQAPTGTTTTTKTFGHEKVSFTTEVASNYGFNLIVTPTT
jgi:hypothetical protein